MSLAADEKAPRLPIGERGALLLVSCAIMFLRGFHFREAHDTVQRQACGVGDFFQ